MYDIEKILERESIKISARSVARVLTLIFLALIGKKRVSKAETCKDYGFVSILNAIEKYKA